MTHSHEPLYQIALTCIPKVGGVIARTLVSHCGSPEAVFKERKSRLLKIPGVGPGIVQELQRSSVLQAAEHELGFVHKHAIDMHFYLDDTYPKRLTHYQQSPVLLYSKGNVQLNPEKLIAIVGTRTPSSYGKRICHKIVKDLAQLGLTVVSGLAYGVDIEAHSAALNYGLPTIGVLGSGLGRIYPQAHKRKAMSMMENGGLVTELSFGTGPDKENFPARNRIVAGMVDAVLVVESARSGGSMITAEFANAFHKDVFAIPGRIGDEKSEGCLALIKTHKAHLMDSAAELIRLMNWDAEPAGPKSIQRMIFADLDAREQLVVDLLDRKTETPIDKLVHTSGLSASELASVLLSLEFKGLVRSLPGKRFHIV